MPPPATLLGSLFRRNPDGDLFEERDSHIRSLAEEDIRCGMPPEEAHHRAKLQFGSGESTKESYRDQRGLPALDTAVQDRRYALRGIRENPGFAAVAILSLAIPRYPRSQILRYVDLAPIIVSA
jgi:hypothetical protein